MTSRLTWATNNVDLKQGRNPLQIIYNQKHNHNRSLSGKTEHINIYGDVSMIANFWATDETYNDVLNWWAWAKKGLTFSYAFDSTKTAYTTTIGDVSAGTNIVRVLDETGFSVGDTCIIWSLDFDDEYELVKIASTETIYWLDHLGNYIVDHNGDYIVFGFDITLEDNLHYDYVGGSEFRHHNYFKYAVILQKELDIQQVIPTLYKFEIEFLKDDPPIDSDTKADTCNQSQTVDSPALTVNLAIASPEDSDHTHTTDEPSLILQDALTVNNVEQSQTVDSPTALFLEFDTAPVDADHTQTVDSPSMTIEWDLDSQDVDQSQVVDTPFATVEYNTSPSEVSQSQTVDSPVLSLNMTIDETSHTQTVDEPSVALADEHLVDELGNFLIAGAGEPLIE